MTNIFAKNFYSLMLKDKCLYMTGDNDKELICSEKPQYTKFTKISEFDNIKYVACGYGSIFIILDNGDVYAKGGNKYGQLGTGDKKDLDEFTKINITNVKSISCGSMFTYFLLDNGDVMSCGQNDYGQLGLSTDDLCITVPTHVNINNIIDISCGHSHVMALNSTGEVYVTGMNMLGQLGLPCYEHDTNSIQTLKSFYKVQDINNVTKITCGTASSYLVSNDCLFSTGCNLNGQMGLGLDTMENVFKFTKIEDISNISDIVAGDNNIFVILKDGVLLACGDNSYKCLGIDTDEQYINKFKRVDINNVKSVSCGTCHTIIQTNIKIVGLGDSSHGQLGLDSDFVNNHLICTMVDLTDNKLRKPLLTWLDKDKQFIKKINFRKDNEYVLEGEKSDNIILYLVNNLNGKKDAYDISNIKLKIIENDTIKKEKWLFAKCNYDFINLGNDDNISIESMNKRNTLSGAINDGINNENTAMIELYMIPKLNTDVEHMSNDFKLIIEYDYGEI